MPRFSNSKKLGEITKCLENFTLLTYISNFWQNVNPQDYLRNILADMRLYFVTDQGLAIAQQLVEQRKIEISCLP